MSSSLYLIAYDICNEKRLYKTRKTVYPFALGGQKSALEAPLFAKELNKLVGKLSKIINHDIDKVNIIKIQDNPILLGKNNFITFENGSIVI